MIVNYNGLNGSPAQMAASKIHFKSMLMQAADWHLGFIAQLSFLPNIQAAQAEIKRRRDPGIYLRNLQRHGRSVLHGRGIW